MLKNVIWGNLVLHISKYYPKLLESNDHHLFIYYFRSHHFWQGMCKKLSYRRLNRHIRTQLEVKHILKTDCLQFNFCFSLKLLQDISLFLETLQG